ncbi:hypothetical protein L873DRAFT_1793356 [Choiromyces venosus 120613-1]|uniref:Uncharacterized protein n=1 Tax=Choiromyces venosus 120613-1 TaxID=1336337 RepID=A0A3N4J6L4_9PEZI|nr:hypothetical protein L873DRAFT_1793356 [Choiromyces venosus 120613-1]
MPPKAVGRSKVQPILKPLPANAFYTGIKKKPGLKRKLLSEKARTPPKPFENPYWLYDVSYKLRILSYWDTPLIPSGPTTMPKPTRGEVIQRFRIPGSNLTCWHKEEVEGKYIELRKSQQRVSTGGRRRK